jgi:autonomous glycyl radical cofactor GrcA
MFNERIFQNHIRRIVGLENTEAKVLLNQYREAFKEINAQLMFAQDNTFTEAKLQTILAQLEVGIQALEARIRGDLESSFNFITEQGLEDAVKEVNTLEKKFNGVNQLVPLNAILSSTSPNTYLFNNYTSSIQTYNQDLRSGMQNIMTQALLQRKTLSQVVADLELFTKSQEWRMFRIVRTELHQIYNTSKMDSFTSIKDQYAPDLKKSLVHPMDERTAEDSIELAKKNPIIDIDKPFVQNYNGKELVFMTPPNRPNDRAILVPVRASYDKR